jgi:PLP dependent protein
VTKHGFSLAELARAAEQASRTAGIRLCGLMTMAPLYTDPDMTRPVFERTREAFEKLAPQMAVPADFQILSMGMSVDFRQAVASGATHVRIGTAIFGPRL